MTVPDPLNERLQAIATQEGVTPEDVLRRLLDEYENRKFATGTEDPVEDFIGVFDDDVTDLSETVGQTLHRIFGKTDDMQP